VNARSINEIIFVKGATDGLNLIVGSWGRKNLNQGDEVIISQMEHHANIVPWQLLADERLFTIKVIPMNSDGDLDFEAYQNLLSERTKVVSLGHVSNGIGTIHPIKKFIDEAKKINALTIVDGCQSAPHLLIDVQSLDCDFFVFSGHKTCAPTGVGVLYGKEEILEAMPPYQGGGDMIKHVTFEGTTYNQLPYKFEAGTPNIEGVIGLGVALNYLMDLGIETIHQYENQLAQYFQNKLSTIEGMQLLGNSQHKVPIFTFNIKDLHPLDIGTLLDLQGIAIRTGNHCSQPLIACLGYDSTCRASLSFYNTTTEIDYFFDKLSSIIKKLQ
jgi:cysteine desulfurase/selenocysteine lyase